jgi:DHA1 family tetracycline resistance protein-like MFS transporter
VVYAIVFLDLLGFGIILPSLPYLARTLGASGFELGVLLSAYSVAQFFGSPVFGRISDRIGRRPVLLWSLTGSILTMTLSALAPNLLALCGARFLAGFFAASIGTAQAYLVDTTPKSERAKYMGLLGAAIGLGFVLGPALGAALAAFGLGFRTAALCAAALGVFTLVGALFHLREPRHHRERPARRWPAGSGRKLLPLFLANFAITALFVVFETTFALLGADRFNLAEVGFGMTLFGVGMVMVIVQGSLVGRLAPRLGARKLALVGCAAMLVGIACVPLAQTFAWVMVPLVLVAAGRGFAQPTLTTLISFVAVDGSEGAVLGLSQSFAAAARALIPVLAGAAYDVSQGLPYGIGAGFAALALVMIVSAGRNLQDGRAGRAGALQGAVEGVASDRPDSLERSGGG